MPPIKVHLDTDIGGDIDDLCALALLLRWPNVEIAGITTVAEQGGKRAGYVRYVPSLAQRHEVPVAAGADVALGCFQRDSTLLPEERYWPERVNPAPGPVEDALALLKRSIEQEAVIVGIGPYTNFSLLEHRFPGVLLRARLWLMGGQIQRAPPGFPTWDYTADYNVQADSDAAMHVLESATPTLIPIEVTCQTALRRAYLPPLRRAGPLGLLIARQAEAFAIDEDNEARYGSTCSGLPGDIINFQHDPLAVAAALGWSGLTVSTARLQGVMDRGSLGLQIREAGRPAHVVTSVDAARFNSFWLETVIGRHRPSSFPQRRVK